MTRVPDSSVAVICAELPLVGVHNTNANSKKQKMVLARTCMAENSSNGAM
jgi:hypothetical protein